MSEPSLPDNFAEKIKDEAQQATEQAENGTPSTLLEKARVNIHQNIKKPPEALKVNGELFGTLGNFSLVIGKAKSKKTFLITMAMAAAVRNSPVSDTFEGTLPKDKGRVVFVDTEQSEYHVVKTAQRVLNLSGNDSPQNFDVYGLRPFSTDERNEIIQQIIDNTPDLGLLVIDGVRDIVTSINDEEEATNLASKLLKWTAEEQIHVVTVLHQNKGNMHARGHIGTELINKAEMTASVTVDDRNDSISKVEAEYCRSKPFQTFGIHVNAFGLPERAEGWKEEDESKSSNQKTTPNEIMLHKHKKMLREVESNLQSDEPNYSDTWRQIQQSITKHVESIGVNKAKEYLLYYQNEGLITKHEDPKYYEISL